MALVKPGHGQDHVGGIDILMAGIVVDPVLEDVNGPGVLAVGVTIQGVGKLGREAVGVQPDAHGGETHGFGGRVGCLG